MEWYTHSECRLINYTKAFVSLACMDGPHVVEYPLAVLVNMVELHVVHVVLPRWLHHAVLLPVAPSVRHVTLMK